MLIDYKQLGRHTFPLNKLDKRHEELMKKFPKAELVLVPGVNDVDPELFAAAMNTEGARHLIKTKKIVGMGGVKLVVSPGQKPRTTVLTVQAPAKAELVAETDLSKVEQKAAIKLVENTIDRDLLERWGTQEKRGPVKKAIDLQVKELETHGRAQIPGQSEEDSEEEVGEDETGAA